MADEEIRNILNEFAVVAVERSRVEAAALVNRLIDGIGSYGMGRLLYGLTVPEALGFGRTLSDGWEAANADNAAAIFVQKDALARILTALINAGVASLMTGAAN